MNVCSQMVVCPNCSTCDCRSEDVRQHLRNAYLLVGLMLLTCAGGVWVQVELQFGFVSIIILIY